MELKPLDAYRRIPRTRHIPNRDLAKHVPLFARQSDIFESEPHPPDLGLDTDDPVKHLQSVWGQHDRAARVAWLSPDFEDGRLDPIPGQTDRQGRPGESTANDQHSSRRHEVTLGSEQS